MILLPRPIHGSINPNELKLLGIEKKNILDFSANISPLGTPMGVWDAIKSVDLDVYPDPDCLEIREQISKHVSNSSHQITIEEVFVGNGSNEILHLICRAQLRKNRTALIMAPTYGEYEFACQLSGASVKKIFANVNRDFSWDFKVVSNLIKKTKPNLVIICNPNNPTGKYCRRNEIEILAKSSRDSGSIIVLDEAYLSFVAKPWDSLCLLKFPNIILVRSMSKNYAQTALRLGYAIASEKIISKLRSFQPDWSVNSLAQMAGIVVLKDKKYLSKARRVVFAAKDYLNKSLTELGLEIVQSDANFFLIKVDNASKWRGLLLAKGIVVRDCTSFGLPEYIRIGIRSLEDCEDLVKAITELLKQTIAENIK